MTKRFDGQRVLVLGGSSGIGFATAKAFVNEGAKVVIGSRNKDRLSAATKKLGADVRDDVLANLDKYLLEFTEKVTSAVSGKAPQPSRAMLRTKFVE